MSEPRWQRRSDARPEEICEAALEAFVDKGFAATRLEDIARRAGVSKGTLYLYFADKETLFAEVMRTRITPSLDRVRWVLEADGLPFAELIERFFAGFAFMASASPIGGVAKMVISESRNFPHLTEAWYASAVQPTFALLQAAVERAQARGEVRAGNARLLTTQLVAPFMLSVLWRETFVPVGAEPFDLAEVAREHLRTLTQGLLISRETGS